MYLLNVAEPIARIFASRPTYNWMWRWAPAKELVGQDLAIFGVAPDAPEALFASSIPWNGPVDRFHAVFRLAGLESYDGGWVWLVDRRGILTNPLAWVMIDAHGYPVDRRPRNLMLLPDKLRTTIEENLCRRDLTGLPADATSTS